MIALLIAAGVGWWLRGSEINNTELGSRIDDAVAELNKIENLGIKIWESYKYTNDDSNAEEGHFLTDNQALFFEVEGRLHRLARLLGFIGTKLDCFDKYKTQEMVISLRVVCTSYDEAVDTTELLASSARIKSILNCSTDLVLALRQMRRDILPVEILKRKVNTVIFTNKSR